MSLNSGALPSPFEVPFYPAFLKNLCWRHCYLTFFIIDMGNVIEFSNYHLLLVTNIL
jgi:hypothetical protein